MSHIRATADVPPRPSITLFASSLSMPGSVGASNALRNNPTENNLMVLPKWAWRLANELGKTGMSRAELARRVGVSAPTVTDWLNGKIGMIAGDHLVIVCGVLGLNPTWLITGVGKREAERFIERRAGDRRRRR